MHTSDQELQNVYFSDPLLSIPASSSMEFFATAPPTDDIAMENFASHLDTLHKRLKDMIDVAPSGDKAAMVSSLTTWAQHVAKEPLGSLGGTEVKKEAPEPKDDVKMEE